MIHFTTLNRAKFFMKCGPARWPPSARYHSAFTMAAWIQHLFLCCCSDFTLNARVMSRLYWICGQTLRLRLPGSNYTETSMVTDLLNIKLQLNTVSSTRAGKIRMTRFFMPMGGLPKDR